MAGGRQREVHDTAATASAAGAGAATRTASSPPSRQLQIEIGRCRLPVEDLDQLGQQTVLRLREAVDEPVLVYADERLLARGQLLLLEGKFCVRVTELL